MISAMFRTGILLMLVSSGNILQGQTEIFSFDKDTSLSGWISNEAGRWEISVNDPLSGSKSLHHAYDNSQAGTDYLFHAYPVVLNFDDTLIWQFKIRHSYLPSSANRWTFYIAAGNPSACMPCNETALAVGVNLNSSDDGLNLYHINANGIKRLTKGTFNWEKSIGTGIGIVKIIRLPNGTYQLWAANAADGLWQFCEEVKSNIIPASCYFGISYTYSSAQDRKLWVDDISISSKPIASDRFRVDTFYFLSSRQLWVHFTAPIDPSSINASSVNFSPSMAGIRIESGCQYISVTFPEGSYDSISGQLHLIRLQSQGGLIINDTILPISRVETRAFDIVFSELMVDPTPTQGLPPFEYIECYNRSNHDIAMSKWVLSNGSSKITLPDIFLPRGSYLLITSKEAHGLFNHLNHVIYELPSGFLNNEKGTLWLSNEKGEIISYVQYQSDYNTDKIKREGGWSLEIIDPDNPCGGSGNWAASRSLSGGTPGYTNSVAGKNPDRKRPFLSQIALPDDSTCILFFSELLHPYSLLPENYTLQSIGHPVQTSFFQNNGRAIELKFNETLQKDVYYHLAVASDVTDCVAQPVTDTLPAITLPELPDSGEIVINEILFETDDTLTEFVELYNATEKFLDAGSLYLIRLDTISGEVISGVQPLPRGLIMGPGSYLAITNDADKLLKYYHSPFPGNIFSWGKIFTLPDLGARLELQRGDGRVIDQAVYSSAMHFPLLQRTRGVSIERVNPRTSGLRADNWHSAAASAGYATPGAKNSQFIVEQKNNNNWLCIRNSTFSPNNDGVDDILTIDIKPSEPSTMVTLSLYTAEGRWVRHIAYQQYIGSEATFTWDGTVNGRLLPAGIYILYARLMNSKHIIGEQKKTCTLVY